MAAGRAFIEALRRNPREFCAGQFAHIRESVCACADGHPQADNAALIALADALADFYVFSPGKGWSVCVNSALVFSAWVLDKATGAAAGDTDLKAIQFIAEWLVRNRLHFEDSAEMDRLERWGVDRAAHRPAGLLLERVLQRDTVNEKLPIYTNETYPIAPTPVGLRRQPALPGSGYFCSAFLSTGTSLSL